MSDGVRPLLFVLGVERCGSTWVANIFDSSPEVLFFMEPFADFAEIFKGFPDRLSHLSHKTARLEQILIRGMENLCAYKYPLFDRHAGSPLAAALTRRVLRGRDRIVRFLWGRPDPGQLRYRLLNLNRLQPGGPATRKSPRPGLTVIKELRLNFKIGVLAEVFPRARYLVVIRNPLAQVHSILKLFARGRLEQLGRVMAEFPGRITGCRRFGKFEPALASLEPDSMLEHLVAYWFVNYDTLLADLARRGCEHRVVHHERLCEDPQAVARELFEWCGCRYGEATRRYLAESSTRQGPALSALDTRRNSRRSYQEALSEAEESIGPGFRRAGREFWELAGDALRTYRTRPDDREG